MLIDYHLHNHFSPDSEADTRELLKKEQELGIKAVCLTNHAEWFEYKAAQPGKFDYYEAMRRFETIEWELSNLRPNFPDMSISLGVELQYQPQSMDDLKRFVNDTPFDFVLGSVHIIDGVIISSHRKVDQIFPKLKEQEAYHKYFEDLIKLIEWGELDVVAHFDVVKKYGHEYYGPFQPQKYKPIILKILQMMKDRGMGIELNTGSLHKRCEELFPHPDILKWALEVGIEHFTLSSDAHEVDLAGKYVPEALAIAKEVGISSISTYEKRKATKHKI